jgi:hypothetical protein
VDRPHDADLDELATRAEETGQLCERLLSEPVDDGALKVRAGVIVAQALQHAGGWFNCSGTLVSPTTVVTAGHCAFRHGAERRADRVRLGRQRRVDQLCG